MERESQTSVHVRRIAEGDLDSLAWVVERFTPLLLAQAESRLSGPLRRLYDPADLVNDVWSRVLAHLSGLEPHHGSASLAVLKYASTALVRRVISLVERQVAGLPPEPLAADSAADPGGGGGRRLADPASGVITRAVRGERRDLVHAAIGELEAQDREILVLCGIEQRPHKDVAVLLGISANLVAQRYRRAIARLRERLPASVFDDLLAEAV